MHEVDCCQIYRLTVLVGYSVDATTEAHMQQVVRDEFQGRTIIAVAHHLRGILDFDRVIVMAHGSVLEAGRPRDLAQTEGSAFRELCNDSGEQIL